MTGHVSAGSSRPDTSSKNGRPRLRVLRGMTLAAEHRESTSHTSGRHGPVGALLGQRGVHGALQERVRWQAPDTEISELSTERWRSSDRPSGCCVSMACQSGPTIPGTGSPPASRLQPLATGIPRSVTHHSREDGPCRHRGFRYREDDTGHTSPVHGKRSTSRRPRVRPHLDGRSPRIDPEVLRCGGMCRIRRGLPRPFHTNGISCTPRSRRRRRPGRESFPPSLPGEASRHRDKPRRTCSPSDRWCRRSRCSVRRFHERCPNLLQRGLGAWAPRRADDTRHRESGCRHLRHDNRNSSPWWA